MNIKEQIQKLLQIKVAIKQAIRAKGVSVSDDTPFINYASLIGEISGGGTTGNITDTVIVPLTLSDSVTGNISDSIEIT